MLKNLIRPFLPVAALLSAVSLFAEPIAYQIIFPATGSITYTNGDTQDFTDAKTVVTVFGDTSNVQTVYNDGSLEGYEIYYIPATIAIQGVGSFGAGNFMVSEAQGGGLEFLQYTMFPRASQTITVQISQNYNLQTNITSGMTFSTNYFNMGYIQTNAGKISFTNTTGTGFIAARLNK